MANPTPYTRVESYATFQQQNPDTELNGSSLDGDFDGLKRTTDETIAALGDVRRDDGALKNNIVTPDTLSSATAIMIANWTIKGAWVTSTAYALKDYVVQSSNGYVCVVAHTSGVFATDLAAGKWVLVSTKGDPGANGLSGDPGEAGPSSGAGGRLTLVSGSPFMTSNQASKTSIFFTPYLGNLVPIYDGERFVWTEFSELENVTTASSVGKAGPAAVANNSNYDGFVWDDDGTNRLTRGPAWTSDTARGTGAGTTELVLVNGIYVNKYDITNGPAAGRGTYVGSFRSDSSAKLNWHVGGLGPAGVGATLYVWNMFNRRTVKGCVADSVDGWGYAGGTFRAANGSVAMRVSFIMGLQEDYVEARYDSASDCSGGASTTSIGLNSTTSPATGAGRAGSYSGGSFAVAHSCAHAVRVLGFNYLHALENNVGATATFYGDNGAAIFQGGLRYEGLF